MDQFLNSIFEVGSGGNWLIAAVLMLCLMSGLGMLRYRRLYLAARDDKRHSDDLIENLSEGIYRSSPDGRQISANKALVRLNGYDSEAEMLRGVHDIATEWYVQPRRRDEFREILKRDGQVEDFVSEIYRHKTRERIWVTESARLVRNPQGKPLFYEGSVREITETMNRLKLEEQFRKLTRSLPAGLFQFAFHADGGYSVPYVSEGVARITELPYADHLARPQIFNDCIVSEDLDGYLQSLMACNATLEPWDHEFRIRAAGGQEKWLRIMARAERGEDGSTVWHGSVTDVSTRKKHEMEIRELAYFDTLTKLPNRRMFLNRMARATEACERQRDFGALLFIDLDNFKTLNDTQGHDVGDEFLVEVASRLRRCVEASDLVARIGGDEFVVVIEQAGPDVANSTRRAIMIANRVLQAMRQEFELGELRHGASASVGVVVFDGGEKRADEILKRADIAMYQAKAAGRNGMALFDPATMDRESARYRLLADLRLASDNEELELYLQPQVDDAGKISGAEALLRWNHPSLGMILPDQFIALAEQCGLGNELATFVFDRGLKILRDWQDEPKTAGLRLALNVSAQCFSSDDFIPLFRRLLDLHGPDPKKLTFELTEHVMAKDHKRIAARMDEVKQLGVRLSLDDFGTGYSSLAYLKQLPFDEVKIDGGFVADIETTDSDRALVKTILAMARTLGLTAVAEHVENIRQEAFLRAFGCDYFQGFLYSRAVPQERFLALVRQFAEIETKSLPPSFRHQA